MSGKKSSKFERLRAFLASFLVLIGFVSGIGVVATPNEANAVGENGTTVVEEVNDATEDDAVNDTEDEKTSDVSAVSSNANKQSDGAGSSKSSAGDNCKSSLGALGWLVCPTTGKIAEAVDWLYGKIEEFLVVSPISTEDGSPIYEIWKYCRGVTNIVFIIFFLIVIYSQITGLGISNYGIKKSLPKLIIAAILVNLSFLICSIAVDVSNIVGNSLRGLFVSVEQATVSASVAEVGPVSLSSVFTALTGGTALAVGAGMIAFDFGMIWMLIPVALGAIVAVVTGLITIALRQAVVALLIMISPLAMVAYMLPNTEQWFKKWKNLLTKMLVFYPVFSLLFGASSLAGFAIIMSAKDGFGLLLGIAVQIFPLFFAWSLMKMSGTFLGAINSRLNGLAATPLAANRGWAASRRAQSAARNLQYGTNPSSRLRRFLDNRRELREQDTANLQALRKNEANMYVQRKISAGYDGTKAQGNKEYLKPNRYTKTAKDLSTSGLRSETMKMDTAHALSNYGDYYVSRNVRERVVTAEKAGNKALAAQIKAGDVESRRNATAANAFLEYSRAQMTAENDSEADFNFMVSQYLDTLKHYDPNDDSGQFSKYRHYIMSSAGGLGETGQTRVLGKIIARAAAVESNQRRDINIVAAKYPHAKADFRNMFVGYYVNDDGYATDKEGNVLEEEKYRGYLLQNHPEKLVLWDHVDEQGRKYYDWRDSNGQFVTRIYDTDGSAFKELLSNYDANINDPINNLYGILAGIKPGDVGGGDEAYKHIGLDRFRTTIGRALLSAPFKEKNAAFSPMVAEMVKRGYIQNYAQEYLAYLDSLNKATKPGAFNVQDADAIKMFTTIMDPDKWDEIFPTELIRGYRNVNGEPIYGIRINENGEKEKVPAEEATREELLERIKEKYIIPAGKKITVMMSRQTQNTMDNQKAGTIEEWKNLKEVFDEKWGEGRAIEANPYEQNGDMREINREIKESLYTVDADGNRHTFMPRRGANVSDRTDNGDQRYSTSGVNYAAEIFEMYNSSLDADDYATQVTDYCRSHNGIGWIADQLQDYIAEEGYGVTKEQLHEKVEELLAYVDYD